MRIRAKNNFTGFLDLSAEERLQEKDPLEKCDFRLTIKPGQTVTVDDKYRFLHNIQSALAIGYIEILSHEALRIHVGTTAPDHPSVNDLWVDTNP